MITITPHLSIPEEEVTFTFISSSGPGGQNVNKVASAVELRFDLTNSSLPSYVKSRLKHLVGRKINREGVLIIKAQRYRSQQRNRADAQARFINLLQASAKKSRERKAIHPTQASRGRRLGTKKHRSVIKQFRQDVGRNGET